MARSPSPAALLGTVLVLACAALAVESADPTVDALKDKLAHASVSDQPGICIQIAHLQMNEASKALTENAPEQAVASLNDVAQYSEQAGDAAIKARSHEKQTEISVRRLIHRLTDMKRGAIQEDQAAIQSTIDRLERVRDSLLGAMFPQHPPK